MRPSFPILQCLRPKCLLSRFTPHTRRNRGIFQVKLSDRTGGISTGPWQKQDDIRPSNEKEKMIGP